MKMSKKTAVAVVLLVTSITTGAFIYGSGIARKSVSNSEVSQVEIASNKASEAVIPQDEIKEEKVEAQAAPPAEVKPEAKAEAPAPKPVKKTVTAVAPKRTTVSRGATAAKTTTKTTTAKSAAYTASAYNATQAERDLLARLVSAEAGGESLAGKLAVATVIMNRVKSPDYPNTIRGVIYDKEWGVQFTPTADGRINEPATAEAIKAADMVLDGYRSFGTKIMFFVNPSKSVNMYVINNKTYYTTIGQHKFYY